MIILGLDGTARLARIMRANLLDELNKALCRNGAGQRHVGVEAGAEVSGAPFSQPIGQHDWLVFAAHILRQRDCGHRSEFADHRSHAAALPDQPGHVPRRHYCHDIPFSGCHRHPYLGYFTGLE